MNYEQLLQAISNMMDEKLKQNLSPISYRLDRLEAKVSALEAKVSVLETGLANLSSKVSTLEAGQLVINSKISTLEAGQTAIKKDLNNISIKVTNTYQLALEAWEKSTENRHWLEHSKLTL